MKIEQSTPEDTDTIIGLYQMAVLLQREKGAVQWPTFERSLVATEIDQGRQWKIVVDDRPRCVWAIADSDPLIWQERNADPAVYIHRIATDPAYRGRGFTKTIVRWAKEFAAVHNRRFVRMDTVGNNAGLIHYYTKCGFQFLGLSVLQDTTDLPLHYHGATVSLFQIEI